MFFSVEITNQMPYSVYYPLTPYHGISDGPQLTKKVQIVSIHNIYDIFIYLPDSDTLIVSYHRNYGIIMVNR